MNQGNPIYDHLKLFAYEGGQHYLGFPNTHNDPALTELMQELSRRPEMQQWYFDYLTHWDQIGGEDFMIFESMGDWTQWGSWSVIEYEGQPLSESPKLAGILDYLASVASAGGDFDGDGDVDGSDFLKWQQDGGSAGELADWVASYGDPNNVAASAQRARTGFIAVVCFWVLGDDCNTRFGVVRYVIRYVAAQWL